MIRGAASAAGCSATTFLCGGWDLIGRPATDEFSPRKLHHYDSVVLMVRYGSGDSQRVTQIALLELNLIIGHTDQMDISMISMMKRCRTILCVVLLCFGYCLFAVAKDGPSSGSTSKDSSTAAPQKIKDAASDKVAKDSQNQPNETATFPELLQQWKAALVNVAELQAAWTVTPTGRREVVGQQYGQALANSSALTAQLQAAAEKAFTAGDQKDEAGKLLLTMAVANIRDDNYEEALRLVKLLIDGKYSNPDMYRVGATAALATMHLDDAKKYLEALGVGKVPTESELQALAAEIEYYRPRWEREQKLRQAEAKADDLPRVKLHTTRGDMVVELFENDAPNTVANFVNLVEKGLYDNTQFHRVLPGFMAQGGDPLSKDPAQNKDNIGKGNPGYFIPDEFSLPTHRDHFRGMLSMAHSGQPNSSGSQFFMMFAPTPNLDGGYTVFGRVIDGLDVLSKLQRLDPDAEHDRPAGNMGPDKILKAEVLRKRNHAYEPKTIPAK
jgi:cyclophilin family peptidyl-prolyl cis-trans isomerase